MLAEDREITVITRLKKEIHQAVLDKDSQKAEALKYLFSLLEKERLRQEKFSPAEAEKILRQEMKRKKEALALFEKGERADLVAREKKEIELLANFLPEELSEEKIRKAVRKTIKVNPKADFGTLMSQVMGQLKGKAEGSSVVRIVQQELEQK